MIVLVLVVAVAGGAFYLRQVARSEQDPDDNQTTVSGKADDSNPARLPRLLDLGSDRCIPCKMMAPILEELEEEYGSIFEVEVIDVRKNREVGVDYGIRVIPTQIFFDASGKEVFRNQGFMSKEDILMKWSELGVDPEPRGSRHQ
jgi:thiol-disulfide isomerase/thioredoxin